MDNLYYFDDWMLTWAEWGWFGFTLIMIIAVAMILIGGLIMLASRGIRIDIALKLIIPGIVIFIVFNLVGASLFGFDWEKFLTWYFQEFILL